jgi:hypothetical protein
MSRWVDTDVDDLYAKYDQYDDDYDVPPMRKGGQVNNRMGTLNRQAGVINRYRKAGVLT